FSVAYDGFRSRSSNSNQVISPSQTFVNAVTNPVMKSMYQNEYIVGPASAACAAFLSNPANLALPLDNSCSSTATTTVGANADQDTGWIRLDQQITDKQSAFLTFNIIDAIDGIGSQGGNGLPGTGVGAGGRFYATAFQHTYALAPNKINAFRMTYNRNPFSFPLDGVTNATLAAGGFRTAGPFAGQPYSGSQASPNGFPFFGFLSGTFSNVGQTNGFP